jgi:RNA polymerase sigma-70 factor (ECF subfamily)
MTDPLPNSPADSPLIRSQAMPGEKAPGADADPEDAFQSPDWEDIVARIQAGDPAAMEELYVVFGKGVRYFLLRNVGAEEVDDKVHDCFVIVAEAIRNGELREPARLMGYVRTVVRRQIAGVIEANVTRRRTQVDYEESLFTLSDWKDDPEKTLVAQQRAEIGRRVLNGVSRRDREILHRFYVQEQSMEQICSEMDLSYNQFRLLKSRAKARFGEMGRRLAAGMGISKKL